METPSPDAALDQEAPPASKGPLRLLFSFVAFTLATGLTIMAVIYSIPDVNDYAEASVMKHERLASLDGRKLVFIGGSNLGYGIESDIVERETGCDVANMGMNGWFGTRFILSEVRPYMKSGDIAVIAFEWDNYGKSVDGDGASLLAVARSNPAMMKHLTPKQFGLIALEAPKIAQTKILRVFRRFLERSRSITNEPSSDVSIVEIESARHLDKHGDLNGHVGVEYDYPVYNEGDDIGASGLDKQHLRLIRKFEEQMTERGVTVILSYTPTARLYYDQQSETIDLAHELLTSGPDGLYAPRPPKAYVFETDYFFDTIYHLKATTRGERSLMVAEDVNSAFGGQQACNTNTP